MLPKSNRLWEEGEGIIKLENPPFISLTALDDSRMLLVFQTDIKAEQF